MKHIIYLRSFKTLAFIFLSLSITLQSVLADGFLKVGSYVGKKEGVRENASLMLQPVEGNQDSFFAVLMIGEKKLNLFLISKVNNDTYSMTEMGATADGEVGIKDIEPKFQIQLQNDQFLITSATDAGRDMGYYKFSLKQSDSVVWLKGEFGEYRGSNDRVASIGKVNSDGSSPNVTLNSKDKLSGSFYLREKQTGIYSLNHNQVTSKGVSGNSKPTGLVVFLRMTGIAWGKDFKMVIFNPLNPYDLAFYTKKN